tara:strand:- start:1689 stop:1901 length:213 start_codon:yes stop_codon:yes gene_type:complete
MSLSVAAALVKTLDDDAVMDMIVKDFNLKAWDWKKTLIAHHWICSCKYGCFYMKDMRDLLTSLLTKTLTA